MTPPRWNLATACAGVSTPNRARFSAETVSAVPPVTYGTNSWPTFCSRLMVAMVASISSDDFFGVAAAGTATEAHRTALNSVAGSAHRGERGIGRTYERTTGVSRVHLRQMSKGTPCQTHVGGSLGL